ncbi:DUF4331 family protein [Bradyrhizobium sp. CCGB01]|uniref:DUF4331 family protein n=1 Tax=Bradyrhizobium sp. CCGB01 TaxID=2949634 RepID=UPI0020B43BEC|nr:DUF4331 family protein [Bradyrhizobium sp. CCGB01]MCP3408127.1 DUF4331 family protein [Bradyrhizobium sp. CCGB01]
MSDHIDGPRQIGDPSADLTDLFAFTSPENPSRTVLAANVFPTCGRDAMFSNAITHSIVVRRAKLNGLGDTTKFVTSDPEIRFGVRFDSLERGAAGQKPIQRGTCTFPDGQTLRVVVNDEKGASTPDGTFRVFAGLRSDPFILAWIVAAMKPFQNLLQNDNVLCIVIEFDTRRVLEPDRGSLFGVIAETVPLARQNALVGHEPSRLDWVGRPEQTNVRLNCAFLKNADDLRDLWNQQTPFAIADRFRSLFLQRLKDSLAAYDMHDGKQDWTPAALAANANMFLDDFLLFDVAKPINDTSHMEIEKSTLDGKTYQTGGGRTVDANVIDILLTWIVNHDREPLRGGATKATKPGTKTFPYFATPNLDLQQVSDSINLDASPDRVWELVGQFGGAWHPLVAQIKLIGTGVGELRIIETVDRQAIIERLDDLDNSARSYRYTNIAGIPASNYTGTFQVKPNGAGSTVEWRAQYLGNGQGDLVVKTIISTLFKTGLESLKQRFGAAK